MSNDRDDWMLPRLTLPDDTFRPVTPPAFEPIQFSQPPPLELPKLDPPPWLWEPPALNLPTTVQDTSGTPFGCVGPGGYFESQNLPPGATMGAGGVVMDGGQVLGSVDSANVFHPAEE